MNSLGVEFDYRVSGPHLRVGKHLPMVLGAGFDVTITIPVFILLLRLSVLTLSSVLIT